MLYLMRKKDESIMINEDIELKVVEINRKSVKLGFSFPVGNSILRKELYERIQLEKSEDQISSVGETLKLFGRKKKVIDS